MSRTIIGKFIIELHPRGQCLQIQMPTGAMLFTAGLDGAGKMAVWAFLEAQTKEREPVFIHVIGTGWQMPEGQMKFLGTIVKDTLVWHVFQQMPDPRNAVDELMRHLEDMPTVATQDGPN